MATFWEIAARSVGHMFPLSFVYLYFLFISHFGFKSGIATVPVHCFSITFTKEGVTKLLKGLNPSKALGPDELHPRVLKELARELGPVLPIFSSNRLIQVKYLGNGLLQTFAPCSRRVTGLLHAIIARFS